MYNVLCFGDSNTWGFMPSLGTRYPRDVRWTGVTAKNLGEDFYLIEEGMNGRTCGHSDIISPQRSGKDYIYPCLISHKPLDLIIVMLGTNDTKSRYRMNAFEISKAMTTLLQTIQSIQHWEGMNADLLLISPIPLDESCNIPDGQVDAGSIEVSRKLPSYFEAIAKQMGIHYMNAADYVTEVGDDGIHFTPKAHAQMAEAVTAKIREIRAAQGR